MARELKSTSAEERPAILSRCRAFTRDEEEPFKSTGRFDVPAGALAPVIPLRTPRGSEGGG